MNYTDDIKLYQKLLDLSDDKLNTLKAVLDIKDEDPTAYIVITYVCYHWLKNSGFEEPNIIVAMKYFNDCMRGLGKELNEQGMSWRGPLYIIMLQDNRFIATEWDLKPFDMNDLKSVDRLKVPIPLSLSGVSPVTAYLRMLATIQSQHCEEEDSGSD
jgi:hypothetical protein